jgi:hypothetical protein
MASDLKLVNIISNAIETTSRVGSDYANNLVSQMVSAKYEMFDTYQNNRDDVKITAVMSMDQQEILRTIFPEVKK